MAASRQYFEGKGRKSLPIKLRNGFSLSVQHTHYKEWFFVQFTEKMQQQTQKRSIQFGSTVWKEIDFIPKSIGNNEKTMMIKIKNTEETIF
jgi:riboflavin synthase alpha subunit